MELNMLSLVLALAGVGSGALVCWLWMRSAVVAAQVGARAGFEGQLSTAAERARGLEQERDQLQRAQHELKAQAQAWRDQLDAARDDRAQLTERASRVPALEQQVLAALEQLGAAQAELTRLAAAKAALDEKVSRIAPLQQQLADALAAGEAVAAVSNQARQDLAEVRATLESERLQTGAQLALLQEARTELSNQFKALASEILEEKSKRFVETNQQTIGQLVNPLRERMNEFKAKVEEIHAKDLEQQATLKAELGQLKELNRQMSDEAHGLAVALKGQAKTQGNWGELVLGNVLDRAGLCEGKDFKREVSFETEDGRRRPDVVLYLPQNKHLVIDAKVSLNAYTRYVNSDDAPVREIALREHVAAISSRIAELADRKYYDLPGLNTPEMVFMFIPIESAFVEALRADESLFQRAIERNILVATPTTLLTSLNIVRQLWRFEEQNAHTAALADKAGKVYAKLATFVGSMEKLGRQLGTAKESYDAAMGQLVEGKGNLINQAKDFEKLGVAVKAQLPGHLVEKASLELDYGGPTPIEYIPSERPAAA
jgi:DNA recombination protein RmuC